MENLTLSRNIYYPLKYTSQRHIPNVARSDYTSNTHSYRHTDIDTIIIQYPQPRLNLPAGIAIVLLAVRRLHRHLNERAVN